MEKGLKVIVLGMHDRPESGGLDRYFHELTKALGNEVESFVVYHPEDPLRKRWRTITDALVPRLDKESPFASHFALYAYPLRRQLQHMPHIIHFHGPWAAESKLEGARPWLVFAKKQLEKAVYKTGDRFIVLSGFFRDILMRDYAIPAQDIRVIPGGIATERYAVPMSRQQARAKLGWPEDAQIVLCVRRLTPRTGVQNLVDAWAEIAQKHPQARLMIAGRGPMAAELAEKIHKLGLEGSVTLLGFLPDEDLPIAYRAADFSIVPTIDLEGFGLITLESMAAGTPVLVTPVGGLPETIEKLDSKLILEDSTVAALCKGLCAALSGDLVLPDEQTCQNFVRQNFDWSVITPRIQTVYAEAAALYQS